MQYNFFQVDQKYILIALIILYSIPIFSLFLFPLKKIICFNWVHAFFGRIEWFLSVCRDLYLPLFLIAYIVYLFIKTEIGFYPFVYILFIGFSFWNYFHRRTRIRKFINFIIGPFVLEPKEFLKLYFASISGLPGHLPASPKRVVELPYNCLNGKTNVSILPAIPGIIDTAILARLVIRASKWKGATYSSKVADAVLAIWGARIVQLAAANLTVEGQENLKNISGRIIFAANHKSFVDFTVVPLLIGLVNLDRKKPFKMRFMAARSHFFDNKLLYSVLGLGKAMEKVGTIFVDRKSKKKRASEAISEASKAMIEEGVDIIMYPQGTRAHGNKTGDGKRMDAGYYTTGTAKKLVNDRGHMKKGAAYLAVDVAAELSKVGRSLNIVPIGLVGTGTVAPRGKIRVQKGVNLKIIIGHPIVLGPNYMKALSEEKPGSPEYNEARGSLVESVFVKIDERLKAILRIHDGLKRRLLIDAGETMRDDKIDRFMEAMSAWRDDEDLIFSIIDCIYSLPAGLWGSHLNQLAGLLIETDTSRDKVVEFKKMVVGEMVKKR